MVVVVLSTEICMQLHGGFYSQDDKLELLYILKVAAIWWFHLLQIANQRYQFTEIIWWLHLLKIPIM